MSTINNRIEQLPPIRVRRANPPNGTTTPTPVPCVIPLYGSGTEKQCKCALYENGFLLGHLFSKVSNFLYGASTIVVAGFLMLIIGAIMIYSPEKDYSRLPEHFYMIRILFIGVTVFDTIFMILGRKKDRKASIYKLISFSCLGLLQYVYMKNLDSVDTFAIIFAVAFLFISIFSGKIAGGAQIYNFKNILIEIQGIMIYQKLVGSINEWTLTFIPAIILSIIIALFTMSLMSKFKKTRVIGTLVVVTVIFFNIFCFNLDKFSLTGKRRILVLVGPILIFLSYLIIKFSFVMEALRKSEMVTGGRNITKNYQKLIKSMRDEGMLRQIKQSKVEEDKVSDSNQMRFPGLRAFGNQIFQLENNSYKEDVCQICFLDEPNTVYDPCQHAGFCKLCSETICSKGKECPICEKPLKGLIFYKVDQQGRCKTTGFRNLEEDAVVLQGENLA